MQRFDLSAFEAALQETAQFYKQADYSPVAVKHWFKSLEEFDLHTVGNALRAWCDRKTRPPTPADVKDICEQWRQKEAQQRGAVERKAAVYERTPRTEYGSQCLSDIRAKCGITRRAGKWWAYELRDRARAGALLSPLQAELSMEVCGADWDTDRAYGAVHAPARRERAPGEDDQ